jgi:hypothetical protein
LFIGATTYASADVGETVAQVLSRYGEKKPSRRLKNSSSKARKSENAGSKGKNKDRQRCASASAFIHTFWEWTGRDRGKRQQMPLVIHGVLQLRSARHFAAAELRSA